MFDSTVIDVRLSLRTASRADARDRGAALSAATKAIDARPTEDELRQIARAAYDERLGRICDEQRAKPHQASLLSVRNRSHADYFGRLRKNGGHIEMVRGEEQALRISGCDNQRIVNLVTMVERVLYPHIATPILKRRGSYKIAYEKSAFGKPSQNPFYDKDPVSQQQEAPSTAEPPRAAAPETLLVQKEWADCTPIEAAKRMIAALAGPLVHRNKGKRAQKPVGEQTIRQIL